VSTWASAEISDESLLGAGVRSRPAYDGSDSQVLEVIPILRYFGQAWFVRTTQDILEGGLRTEIANEVHAGAQLAYEPGRQTSESSFLERHRVPFVDRGASVGAQVEYDHLLGPMPINVLARARQDADLSRGAQVDLRLSAGVFQEGPVGAGLFTQATWASAKSVNSFYGIAPQESLATGLPAYDAGSGWLFVSYGLLASVDLSRKWTVVASAELQRLRGDAARSPLIERTSNDYASVALAYRF
jgi:outer membrane scaffolding protein for murein synthesis (MipA/OmpV family)